MAKKKQNPAKQVKKKVASNPLRQQEGAVRRVYNYIAPAVVRMEQ